jgi:acetyl esterase/lipase
VIRYLAFALLSPVLAAGSAAWASADRASPSDWGVQTWIGIPTPFSIYQRDVVYGDTPFLIDDPRDPPRQNYEARGLTIYRAARDGILLESQPVVFFVHGGAWTDGYREIYGYLALPFTGEKGWTTVVIDYRLTADEVTLAGTSAKAAWYPDNVDDVADSFRWVAENISGNGGDPGKIVIFGQSAGAHLVSLFAASTDPDYVSLRPYIKGAVSMSGVYSVKDLNPVLYCDVLNQTFPGGCFNNDTEMDNGSPLVYVQAGSVLPPFYVIYCEVDLPNFADQFTVFRDRLQSCGQTYFEDYLAGYNHVSEMAAFSDSDSAPVVLFSGFVKTILNLRPRGPAAGDYDGDGTSEPALFRESSGLWSVREITRFYLGGWADEPAPADYDGDGTTDAAVFNHEAGLWAIRGITRSYFGGSRDCPLPGDYLGDGTDRIALFRGYQGLWSVRDATRFYLGSSADLPAPADYDGDGMVAAAVYRAGTGLWSVRGLTRLYFGSTADTAVSSDYDGDGTSEIAAFRPASKLWAVLDTTRTYFGDRFDQPVPAAYGPGSSAAPAVFRDTSGLWAIREFTRIFFGSSNDLAL